VLPRAMLTVLARLDLSGPQCTLAARRDFEPKAAVSLMTDVVVCQRIPAQPVVDGFRARWMRLHSGSAWGEWPVK